MGAAGDEAFIPPFPHALEIFTDNGKYVKDILAVRFWSFAKALTVLSVGLRSVNPFKTKGAKGQGTTKEHSSSEILGASCKKMIPHRALPNHP